MPIDVNIHTDQKLVFANCIGNITTDELISYQEKVWNNNEVSGFNCVFDMSQADMTQISFGDLLPFAFNASCIDSHQPKSKLAIVVSTEMQENLAMFYKAAVELLPGDTRTTLIFKEPEQALHWISTGQANSTL